MPVKHTVCCVRLLWNSLFYSMDEHQAFWSGVKARSAVVALNPAKLAESWLLLHYELDFTALKYQTSTHNEQKTTFSNTDCGYFTFCIGFYCRSARRLRRPCCDRRGCHDKGEPSTDRRGSRRGELLSVHRGNWG